MLGEYGLRVVLAPLIAAAAMSACAQETDENTDSTAADTPAVPEAQPAQPGALNDAQIAHIVMTANTADSAGGEMARTRGSQASVKAFGERMIQDHGGANRQVTQLAQGAGLGHEESDVSRQLKTDADQASQRLQSLSGREFDRAYIEHEVQMHQTLLNALDQQLVPAAQNAQLRELLESVRTAVQSHLEQARQIQGQLGQGADTTSTR